MNELTVSDKIIQLKNDADTLRAENIRLQLANDDLLKQVDKLTQLREEDAEKHREELEYLTNLRAKERTEQSELFRSEVATLSTAYQANTSKILESLEQANKDRDKAQMDADSWKTKFNEYIKSHLK